MRSHTPSWYSFLLMALLLGASALFLSHSRDFTGFVTGSNITTANVTAQVAISNSAPLISVDIDSIVQPAAGNTITVYLNVSTNDSNGGADISTINATLFRTSGAEQSTTNNYTSYVNTSCVLNSASGLVRTANCSFRVTYYARPVGNGGWTAKATAIDSSNAQSIASTTFTVGDCVGVFINPGDIIASTLNFGSVAPGSTASNQSLNVSNYCNTQLDLLTQGINLTSGANVLLIRNVSYSFVPWNVSQNTNVTHVGDAAGIFNSSYDLTAQTDATFSNRTMFFNVTVPLGMPSGTYVGALNFTVQKG